MSKNRRIIKPKNWRCLLKLAGSHSTTVAAVNYKGCCLIFNCLYFFRFFCWLFMVLPSFNWQFPLFTHFFRQYNKTTSNHCGFVTLLKDIFSALVSFQFWQQQNPLYFVFGSLAIWILWLFVINGHFLICAISSNCGIKRNYYFWGTQQYSIFNHCIQWGPRPWDRGQP